MNVLLTVPGIIVAALLLIGFVYAAMYKKVARGIALVRTGAGGRKVIIDGGCIRIPHFHTAVEVNLSTVQLKVSRSGEDALITKDSLRVDVTVDFYVSVEETVEGVAQAARTLGNRTFHPDKLRELIEGKLVDALRAVAAGQDMMDLHVNRQEFVREVQEIVTGDLAKNGLQLESVSLTGLDQTPTDNLDPNNMFNATAIRLTQQRVTEETESRAVAEASAKMSEARERARAEEEEIKARERVERSEIEKDRSVRIFRSESEAESRRADIQSKRESETAELEKDEALRARSIERDRALEIAEQERRIAVAQKSESESDAAAKAETARQSRVVAEEAVRTAQESAAAERAKKISVIRANEEAEVDATRIRVNADATREATRLDAQGRREAAEEDRTAAESRAAAVRAEKDAEASGITAVNKAKNTLSEALINHAEKLRQIEITPEIVQNMMSPFQGVGQNMKSVFLHGMNPAGDNKGAGANGSGSGGQAGGRTVMSDMMDGLLGYSLNAPTMKKIGDVVGSDFAEAFKDAPMFSAQSAEAPPAGTETSQDVAPATPAPAPAKQGKAGAAPKSKPVNKA